MLKRIAEIIKNAIEIFAEPIVLVARCLAVSSTAALPNGFAPT